MESILLYLSKFPDYVWQIVAFLLPSNKFFRFISDKLNATKPTT